ncbi:longevity assurance proteins LAG1/LAC1 [Laetiporus sulphureus 93-53]|uniref:Longevity assurance proteins LAG1/LAC1 n=1 Tax=Laetiporus sulphureus 93-53 TaxID=1314785 RepID=A0A165I1T7_9APHY|nr:longevity assurance proteins LAG1/LAC1 [Laetiporus sulphureus 93-53]KZT12481.1 longevity assurance proteins LAG1/LAC1 [Laetiporus sulphureus 93-53]
MSANGHLKHRRPSLKSSSNVLRKSLQHIETDPTHHLAGPFRPQTPLNAQFSPVGSPNDAAPWSVASEGLWADIKSNRWVVVPSSSFKILLIVFVLWSNWEVITPFVVPGLPNPFAPLLFISHPVPPSPTTLSTPEHPRYAKGYLDLVFIAYYIVFWSFFRQVVTLYLCRSIANFFGIKKEAKLARFGEQGYAMVYFAIMGAWGARIMSQLPTWWYRTEYFWIDYPHWEMTPELKRYYLMQAAYWCQQLIVLLLNLEKPRKDYYELVAHHFVTLWLIGWSYLINLTLIGNAVYVSMDIPDTFLAFSKLMNYIQYTRTKVVSYGVFIAVWTYFRHWLNLVILYSVWTEFDLMPETSKRWSPKDGVWLVWWMKYQVFTPILLLLFLNIFWYILMLRIGLRVLQSEEASKVGDERSDDEDDDEDD